MTNIKLFGFSVLSIEDTNTSTTVVVTKDIDGNIITSTNNDVDKVETLGYNYAQYLYDNALCDNVLVKLSLNNEEGFKVMTPKELYDLLNPEKGKTKVTMLSKHDIKTIPSTEYSHMSVQMCHLLKSLESHVVNGAYTLSQIEHINLSMALDLLVK